VGEGHVAGFAAASASWSTEPRGFWGDNSGVMARAERSRIVWNARGADIPGAFCLLV
jgi:hypothetical protein